jgi:hypothetical protein
MNQKLIAAAAALAIVRTAAPLPAQADDRCASYAATLTSGALASADSQARAYAGVQTLVSMTGDRTASPAARVASVLALLTMVDSVHQASQLDQFLTHPWSVRRPRILSCEAPLTARSTSFACDGTVSPRLWRDAWARGPGGYVP